MPYRLFPYERRLGLRELDSLGLEVIRQTDQDLELAGDIELARRRATYLSAVSSMPDVWQTTEQALVESTHLDLRDTTATRQATRYGPHGIHEYKGKFNPQLVRALCNVVDAEADVLIDPFAGSGTALVEGLRLGMDVLGIDHSPIACFIADAKLAAVSTVDKQRKADELLHLGEDVADAIAQSQGSNHTPDISSSVGPRGVSYLKKWFTQPAYAALAAAISRLQLFRATVPGRLALVALSSILRDVSLQLPEDLRVRRRPDGFIAPPMAPLFMQAVHSTRRALLEMEDWPEVTRDRTVVHRSAEDAQAYSPAPPGRRLIVTSPPYATALPYIDTDRLSLVALALDEATNLMKLERSLIGSREWTRHQQTLWDAHRDQNVHGLPPSVMSLVTEIAGRNRSSNPGFRRKAVPTLLYRYFARLGRTFDAWRPVLSRGEAAVVIVGHNHTVAGGERVAVPTPELLGDVAESRGFVVEELIKLQTWPRYGLHAANGVPGEDALVLRRT